MKRDLTWLLIILGALVVWGCDSNQSGDLRASKFGDLTHVLGNKLTTPDPKSVCVFDTPSVVATGLRRRPYLQQISPRSVRIAWTTNGATSDGAVVVTRDEAVMAMSIAERDWSARPPQSAIQWSAALSDLEPDTVYCYEVWAQGVLLATAGFRTAPEPGSGRLVGFVAFGDSGGGGPDQRAVRSQMTAVTPDFVVHLGDIGYESGTRAQLEANFFSVYADLLEHVAVFPASGNHEYETEDAVPFREVFLLPENGAPDGLERWYSYDFGDVHMVALDSERIGPLQAAWLDADLAASHLPWVIVYLHRPPYSSGDHGSDANVQRYFVPLFARHHVPLVLAGHDHDYERTKPQDGVTYVVSGGGGRGTRSVGESSFTAFSEAVCHFLFVEIEGDHLTGHAIDGVGQEFDSFVLQLPAR